MEEKLKSLLEKVNAYYTYDVFSYPEDLWNEIPLKNRSDSNSLYITSFKGAKKEKFIYVYGVKTIVYIGTRTVNNKMWQTYKDLGVTHYHYEEDDDPSINFLPVLNWSLEKIQEGLEKGPVMVHCHVGMSRSVAAVLYYLMKTGEFQDILEAMDHIKTHRPEAHPNDGFLEQVYRATIN